MLYQKLVRRALTLAIATLSPLIHKMYSEPPTVAVVTSHLVSEVNIDTEAESAAVSLPTEQKNSVSQPVSTTRNNVAEVPKTTQKSTITEAFSKDEELGTGVVSAASNSKRCHLSCACTMGIDFGYAERAN